MRKTGSVIAKIVYWVSLVALVLAVLVAIGSRFNIPGGYRIFSVRSGSMQPALPTGALIVAQIPRDEQTLKQGDIITFLQPGYENQYVTHRIAELKESGNLRTFITKGDANEQPDSWEISYGRIKGIYQSHVPFAGALLEFVRSALGIVLLIILPTLILAWKDIYTILNEIIDSKSGNQSSGRTPLAGIMLGFFSALAFGSLPTLALYTSNTVVIQSNSITTAETETRTVRLPVEADAGLDESHPNHNFGKGRFDVRSALGDNQRLLLRFNLAVLPPGTVIKECDLYLYLQKAPALSRIQSAHRLTNHEVGWIEGSSSGGLAGVGESSWLYYAKPNMWSTAGGDFALAATDIAPTGTLDQTWLSWSVAPDCDEPEKRSWLVKDASENSSIPYKANYITREEPNPNLDRDPYLNITFIAPKATTPHMVINEIYFAVAHDKGTIPHNRWIELYNPSDSPIDVSGWKVCGETTCSVLPPTAPLSPGGFAVVTPDASTASYWTLPAAATLIIASNTGYHPGTTASTLSLKDSADTIIDSTVYNFIDVQIGQSVMRLMNGFDTDSNTDFWMSNAPTPGV